MKKFVIIDALALAYKAYFAFISRPLRTKSGIPTSAVYGFTTQFIKILEDIRPDLVAVAFDSKEKTFRHDIYPEYKANRASMPEDMPVQLEKINAILNSFSFPQLILPGYEADDIIGTAVKLAEKSGYQSYMVTPDKDYVQLITKNTFLVKPGKSGEEIELLTVEKVKESYGFMPEQMIDYLALLGDSSDNVPGVKGIGEKSAIPLIAKYSSLENIYNNIETVEPKGIKSKLEANREIAFLSKKLVTIDTNVPLTIDFQSAKLVPPDREALREIFTELEFKNPYIRLMKFFDESVADDISSVDNSKSETFSKGNAKYSLITTSAELKSLSAKLMKAGSFVFDTETNGLDIFSLRLAGVSFSVKEGEAFFIPINPVDSGGELFTGDLSNRVPLQQFKEIFSPIFANPKIKKICQNGKFDIAVLRSCGIETEGFYFDTMIAAFLIDPDQKVGMDELSEKYLNYKPIPLSSLIGEKKDPSKIFTVPLEALSNYAAEDADITLRLFKVLSETLEKEGLSKLAYEVEFPLVEVLEEMERAGVKIDEPMLAEQSKELDKLMTGYVAEIHKEAGMEFNVNSTKQLQEVLFEKLGLKSAKKTKTGYSTDAQTLEGLRGEHPIIEHILNYRQAAKLKSTYTDALPQLINPVTGRVHTSFNQTIAATGRLSSIDPNLQNIPIRTELGKGIRRAFIPRDKKHVILSADYSQIELRIMASMCGDQTLCNAFTKGEDIHRSTAALVFKVKPEDVNADMRRKAKEVNFGILYGLGVFGLKTRLGITQAEAKNIFETYFETFKSVKEFMDSSIRKAKQKGYAETLLGRRRFLRNINSNNFAVRQFEERVAINMPIQGTAADMIKIAMINIHRELKKQKMATKMILQVHDELVFDVPKSELKNVQAMVKELMESALPLNVPVVVETGTGDNWLDAH